MKQHDRYGFGGITLETLHNLESRRTHEPTKRSQILRFSLNRFDTIWKWKRYISGMRALLFLCLFIPSIVLNTSCSDDSSSESQLDGAVTEDAHLVEDGSVMDSSQDAQPVFDADTPDGGQEFPISGWGEISGECNVLDSEEWDSTEPFLFRNAMDFGTTGFDEAALTPGGVEIWEEGNLGGSSIHSEIIAYEFLNRCELADLLKTEGEIIYQDDGGKKTDILLEIDTYKVGVSVTRAYHWPEGEPYTLEEAETLLNNKLSDIFLSAANADPEDAWEHSILYVVAFDDQHATTIETAFEGVDPAVQGDTIIILTVTNGEDEFAY